MLALPCMVSSAVERRTQYSKAFLLVEVWVSLLSLHTGHFSAHQGVTPHRFNALH